MRVDNLPLIKSISPDATAEQVAAKKQELLEALTESPMRIVRRILAALTSDRERIFRKDRNIQDIIEDHDLNRAILTYNIAVRTARERLGNFVSVLKVVYEWAPKVLDIIDVHFPNDVFIDLAQHEELNPEEIAE